MAVKFEVKGYTRGDVFLFAPENIIIRTELNGRHEAPDIEGLIQSILDHGQIQPVTVRMEAGKPVLALGFSRWTAISLINERKLTPAPMKLKCVFSRCNEQDGYFQNYAENHDRNSTTPMDDAHFFAQLEKWNMTTEQIAERLRLKPAFVRDRLALIEATPELQSAVASGKVKPTAAKRLAKMTAKQQRDAVSKNGHKITSKDVNEMAGKVSKPSFRAVREFVEQFDGPGIEDETREVVKKILAFMDGKAS